MKYYYDCPIEAAYMAKNFGVKLRLELIDAETGIIDLQQFPISSWHTLTSLFGTTGLSPYFYITPDSLHIFEPQVGDILDDDDTLILLRNNKPFITPKQES